MWSVKARNGVWHLTRSGDKPLPAPEWIPQKMLVSCQKDTITTLIEAEDRLPTCPECLRITRRENKFNLNLLNKQGA